jgi:hypothetical protein
MIVAKIQETLWVGFAVVVIHMVNYLEAAIS